MKKNKSPLTYEEKYLLSELEDTKADLLAAYSFFDNVIDPYLIDCSIYKLNSVQQRYMFLMKKAEENNVSIPFEVQKMMP